VTEVPTDLWFRTELELTELATGLGAVLRTSDAEDWWAWVIADLDEGVRLDITRPHGVPPADFDTRVFRLGPDRTLPPRSSTGWPPASPRWGCGPCGRLLADGRPADRPRVTPLTRPVVREQPGRTRP
jgi:hypothetical protein